MAAWIRVESRWRIGLLVRLGERGCSPWIWNVAQHKRRDIGVGQSESNDGTSMTRIPEGWFWMGADDLRRSEGPRHRVFTDAYEIAQTPVTRRQYACFLAGGDRAEPDGWKDPLFADPDQPVVGVNWFDAMAYCDWISRQSKSLFRLPQEAEWEKACRGGAGDVPYAWGHEAPESLEYFRGKWMAPRPVAQGPANGYGLFNMGDNVHEWCADWHAPDYYAVSPQRNPRGPETGRRRASRGGSWRHAVKATRTAERSSLPPEYRYTDYGFRLARSVSPL